MATTKRKIRKHKGINQTTGRLKKGYKYGANGRIVKAAGTKSGSKSSAKKKIKKHEGINQKTGRLKKGFRYGSNGRIVKAKK